MRHSYLSIWQPWQAALHRFGNIWSKISLVNQPEMPSPGSMSHDGPAALQRLSAGAGCAGEGWLVGAGVAAGVGCTGEITPVGAGLGVGLGARPALPAQWHSALLHSPCSLQGHQLWPLRAHGAHCESETAWPTALSAPATQLSQPPQSGPAAPDAVGAGAAGEGAVVACVVGAGVGGEVVVGAGVVVAGLVGAGVVGAGASGVVGSGAIGPEESHTHWPCTLQGHHVWAPIAQLWHWPSPTAWPFWLAPTTHLAQPPHAWNLSVASSSVDSDRVSWADCLWMSTGGTDASCFDNDSHRAQRSAAARSTGARSRPAGCMSDRLRVQLEGLPTKLGERMLETEPAMR